MAAEAFDPFADDDDDEFVRTAHRAPPTASPVVASRVSPKGSPLRSSRQDGSVSGNAAFDDTVQYVSRFADYEVGGSIQTDDIMNEFDDAFPSMTLGDDATDQFGFPTSVFPATFEHTSASAADASTAPHKHIPTSSDLEGVTFVIAEEMSVIHKSETNQCSVKVRGNVSIEPSSNTIPGQSLFCDVSVLDPKFNLDTVASKNFDCAKPLVSADENPTHDNDDIKNTTFRLSMPELNGQKNNWFGGPVIEYTCEERLRPVPMLITTTVHEFDDRCQIMFQLRVNPRNANSLLNAVVLVAVPGDYDGDGAQVFSVGRSIGKGKIDTHWSGVTRILSWTLGELYSGAICEFEAMFLPSNSESAQIANGPSSEAFPVLLRYDSEGSLLSDVDLDFGDGSRSTPSVKRKFRVYHREV